MPPKNIVDPSIENYAYLNTKPESLLLERLILETKNKMENPQMLSNRNVGRLLKILVASTKTKTILEIGMFTGYSALSMAEALPKDGRLITCEVDVRAEALAKQYFKESPDGYKIEVRMGPALESLKKIDFMLDFIFIDADKINYLQYYKAVLPKLKSGGLIVFDNSLWQGKVLAPVNPSSKAIDETNRYILSDRQVENTLLTIRDGLNIVRKR